MVAEAAGASTLHVSSVAAVGYSESGVPIDETAPNNFVPLRLVYHESKRLAEDEALAVTGRSACHYRALYGPRELFHKFGHTTLELSKGKIPGHPSGGISVTDVDDAAAGIVSALTLGENGERYLLGGHNLTYGDILRHQAQVIGQSYNGRAPPPVVMQRAARALEARAAFTGKEPCLTLDNAKIAPRLIWYDGAKAERTLGYRFARSTRRSNAWPSHTAPRAFCKRPT